mmetsp:Transcript_5967/g.17261  ORF Transcript_5967/g.17261 Transcript_5967/m.17261 type:complete len:122 (+) Transcript_5967:1239-1604(+)
MSMRLSLRTIGMFFSGICASANDAPGGRDRARRNVRTRKNTPKQKKNDAGMAWPWNEPVWPVAPILMPPRLPLIQSFVSRRSLSHEVTLICAITTRRRREFPHEIIIHIVLKLRKTKLILK